MCAYFTSVRLTVNQKVMRVDWFADALRARYSDCVCVCVCVCMWVCGCVGVGVYVCGCVGVYVVCVGVCVYYTARRYHIISRSIQR